MLQAAQRCRVVAGVLVLLHLGLGATPQAFDLLIALGQDGSPVVWAGLGAGTAWLALNAWFWSRFALRRGSGQHRLDAPMPFLLAAAAPGAVADALLRASASVPDAMGMSSGGNRLVVASAVLGGGCLALLLAGLRAGLAAHSGPLLDAPGSGRATQRMLLLSVAVGAAGLVAFGAGPVGHGAYCLPGGRAQPGDGAGGVALGLPDLPPRYSVHHRNVDQFSAARRSASSGRGPA